MRKSKKWLFFGIIFVVIIGSLSHFLYELSGYNKIVGLFVAINESTWEHIKIALFASFLLMIIEYPFLKNNKNFFIGTFLSMLSIIILIPLFFYGYKLFLDDSLVLDVIDFILSIIIGQLISYKVINDKPLSNKYNILSIIGLIIILICYLTFSYFPIKNIIFKDPVTSSYGINSKIKYVNLGEEVVLKKGETAIINNNVKVTITGFIYSPCPKGAQCIWEGLAVLYDLYVDDIKVIPNESEYKVDIVKSDYKTYAKIKVEKNKP